MSAHRAGDGRGSRGHHFLASHTPESAQPFVRPAVRYLQERHLHRDTHALVRRALAVPGLATGRERALLLVDLDKSLNLLALRDEQEAALDEAVALLSGLDDPRLRAAVYGSLGELRLRQGRFDDALGPLETSMAANAASPDPLREVAAVRTYGNVQLALGRFDDALATFRRALEVSESADDVSGCAAASINIGVVFGSRGLFHDAEEWFVRGRDLARRSGERLWELNAVTSAALIAYVDGRGDEALRGQLDGLRLARELGDRGGEIRAQGMLSFILAAADRLLEARDFARRALEGAKDVGWADQEAVANSGLLDVALRLGQLRRAREHLERMIELRVDDPDRQHHAYNERMRAEVLWCEGRPDEARDAALGSLARLDDADMQRTTGHCCDLLVSLALDRGDVAGAREHLAAAHAATVRFPSPETETRYLAAAFRVANATGEPPAVDVAPDVLAARAGDPAVTRSLRYELSRWTGNRAYLETAHAEIEALAASVPPEERDAVWENVPLHRAIRAAHQA